MSDTASSRNDRKRDANSGEDDVQQVDEISPESSNQATETTTLLRNGNKEHGNNCRRLLCCCFPWCYEKEANDGPEERPIATGISPSAQSYNPSQKDVEVKPSNSPPMITERQDGSAISDDSMSSVGFTAEIQATVPPYDNIEKERIVCQATSSIDPELNTQEKFNETGLATAEAGNLQECRNSSHQNDTSSTNMTTGLNPLSKYLGSLANKIGKHDLHVILFHAENLDHRPIHKRERENIKDPLSLFAKLQEAGHINENHCNVLVHLLQAAYLDMLAIEVSVRYELGFDEDVDDNDLKEMVNKKLRQLEQAKGWSGQSPLRPDGSPPQKEIPCKTCQSHFKEREEELERKYEKTKSESKHYLFIVLQERNNAEKQNAKEHDHCDKEQEKLRIALAKSESDLKQVQDKLELAKQERTRLERQNEMTRKEVERVQDFHKKEKESLENAKSNSESISQQIQDQLDRVIQERTRLETRLYRD
ncbi:uveal autoantigen with coiled-coil domains and ankyrin repeats protein-like [Ptychodera flava]|uniref:uveal autoantigen with coiled-coil domains and ankyrin repeats protein-like n=1 Tax=Ptychodera flava TaxID=63121 RepID=UPI00396AA2A4